MSTLQQINPKSRRAAALHILQCAGHRVREAPFDGTRTMRLDAAMDIVRAVRTTLMDELKLDAAGMAYVLEVNRMTVLDPALERARKNADKTT